MELTPQPPLLRREGGLFFRRGELKREQASFFSESWVVVELTPRPPRLRREGGFLGEVN